VGRVGMGGKQWRTCATFRSSLNRRGARGVIREAIDQIPSGTLLTSCLPLAGDLAVARPHLRAVLGLIGILVCTSRDGNWFVNSVQSPGPVQRLRFRPLQARDDTEPAGRIENLRILHNGAPIRAESTQSQDGSTVLVSFESMVHFNGWAFDTAPTTPVDKDPVVFFLEFERNGKWVVAGGSSPFYFGVFTYLPLPYGTCRPRGCSNIFRELEGNFHSYFDMVARWWLAFSYLRLMMDGSIIAFLKDQHLRTGILYIMGCVLLFARGLLRNLLLEFSTEMGLQEQARLLYDCAGLALPGDTLPYVIIAVTQLGDDRLHISMNEKTREIGMGNALGWNGVCKLCVSVFVSVRVNLSAW